MAHNSHSPVSVSSDYRELYDGYFDIDAFESAKNDLAASDTVDFIQELGVKDLGKCLDFGAGDGFVLRHIQRRGLSTDLTALEISQSGIDRIKKLNLSCIKEVIKFDGYNTPFDDNSFDNVVCAHVLEHVEHERILLKEIRRLAKTAFIIVPLEGGARGRVDRSGGHINYYTPMTLCNLIETSGFEVESYEIHAPSPSYEKHIYGTNSGLIKNYIRRTVKFVFRDLSPHVMTYSIVVKCIKSDNRIFD
jgi:ubiquinone/menaquinone biosynthesis C-methylase UbiE